MVLLQGCRNKDFTRVFIIQMIMKKLMIFSMRGLIQGPTHAFVLRDRDDGSWPADLYLEGT